MTDIGLCFEHERLEIRHDDATGVTAVIAVHSTALGPAMGGLRLHTYNSLDEAAVDALRLSRAMTLKNAAAGLDLGGGKAVLLDDGGWSSPADRAARMQVVGRFVDELAGQYVTAEDVGTTPSDMDHVARSTRWVAGRPVERGGRGDPSPTTARTVFSAIAAAARIQLGADDLAGVRVGVQGVGSVGAALVALLCEAGASVVLTDAIAGRAVVVAERHGARAVEPDGFTGREMDVLAPCALGAGIALADVPRLRCAAIAGAANNPLADPAVVGALHARGVLYVPDFLANCGGIIHVGAEVLGFGDAEVERLVVASAARTAGLLDAARASGATPWDVALGFARSRIAGAPLTALAVAA